MIVLRKRSIKWYGWKKQIPDFRDRHMRQLEEPQALPASASLKHSPFMASIFDQLPLGACVGNGVARVGEFVIRQEKQTDFTPSRLAIYYGARAIEGTVNEDAGCEIRDAIKVIAKQGVATETLWPYVISKFAEKPPAAYYTAAKMHVCISYERVPQTEQGIKSALAAGHPIVYGISVYESFESDQVAKTGTVPMPKSSEQLLGGHCIVMSGYTKRRTESANSWGVDWGNRGYFTLPWDYVLNPDLTSDLWIVKVIK